jgi:flagellar capping protein FliD
MNVTSIANLYSSLQTSNVSYGNQVLSAFDKAASRLESAQQSTKVQISAYGQVKSGFASIESAGQTLAKGSANAVTDTKKALETLVSAYNDTRSAAATTAPGYASNAANTLRRTAANDSVRTDLQSLGITQASDGSLSIDTKKLDAALQANPGAAQQAAARVGGQLQSVATRALSESGGISTTLNALNSRAAKIESQQAGIESLINLQKQTSTSSSAQSGINSYLRIFSL